MTDNGKPALEIVEEAVHLLRSMPVAVLCLYFIGAFPFVLGFLYFWADMSEGAFAQDHAGLESLLVVLLFVWMNCWQTAFVAELRARLSGTQSPPWTLQRIGQTVVVQGGIQPTCFLLLPLAALAMLPLAGVFAFYQSVNCSPAEGGFTGAVAAARKQAARWPLQNWIILSLIALFSLVCFVNVILIIFNGAALLKSFFGIETMVSRSLRSMLNSTFFATVAALTYVAVDPLIKAVYALCCFYGDAVSSGEDLRARLRGIPSSKPAAVAALLSVLLLAPMQAETISTEELNRAMDSVIQQPQYSWRLPRQAEPPGQNSGMLRIAERVVNGIKQAIETLIDWIQKLFGGNEGRPETPAVGALPAGMRFLTIFLTVSLLLIAALAVYRAFSQRARHPVTVESLTAQNVDVSSETASADQLPEEDWMRMGRELFAAGDLRLGVRALYLGALANLGRRELIRLSRSKTNWDYQRELERRTKAMPHVLPAFVLGAGIYERTWYGCHIADDATVRELMGTLERMKADA